jgi:hypothetical protein
MTDETGYATFRGHAGALPFQSTPSTVWKP